MFFFKVMQYLYLTVHIRNSIFKIFGADDKIFESDDNYLEFYIAGKAELGDLLIEVRDNLYLIKITLMHLD